MQTLRALFSVATLFIVAACAHAPPEPAPAAPARGWDIAPFRPHLIRNDMPELCEPYAAAWTEMFDGADQMDSAELDVDRLPHDAIFSFPSEVPEGRAAKGMSLHDQYFVERYDLDADGDLEILLVVDRSRGWRYGGSNLFVFEDEAMFETVFTEFRKDARYSSGLEIYLPAQRLNELAENAMPESSVQFGPLRRVYLILHEGALYSVSGKGWSGGHEPDDDFEVLRRIWPVETSEPVCELQIRPTKEQLYPFVSASPFFQSLKAMYAGPAQGTCYGTMGWTGISPEELLPDILYRPQARPQPGGVFVDEADRQSNAARQLRLLSWGASSSVSWQVYLALRQDEPDFLRRMTEYYSDRFGMTPEQADAAALQAWRALIDRVFYARNNDIAMVKLATLDDTPVDFRFGASLDEILDEIGTKIGQIDMLDRHWKMIWSSTLNAAILSGRPVDEIQTLYEDALRAWEIRQESESIKGADRDLEGLRYGMMAVAITRPDVLGMLLDRGFPASGGTNRFGKTALMYAAQMNEIETARLLIAADAEVNVRTDSSPENNGHPPCGQLERDYRTALMYATENASEDLITLLLDAGADTIAMDSKGNGISWYLSRNTNLSPQDRVLLEARLNPAAD